MEKNKLSQQEIINELWRRGNLTFKLDPNQQELIKKFNESKHKINVWLLSRRLGKSYTLCTLAISMCLKTPNIIVKYVCPTKEQAGKIIRPLINKIISDCPEDLKPKEKKGSFIWRFHNGSQIEVAGSNAGHAERIRGTDSHLAIIDEAGSCNELHNLIRSILLPTTLITKGKLILASTPPKELDHEFLDYVQEAEFNNTLIRKTIWDNPRLTKEEKEEELKTYGGATSEYVRREYFCEIIKSTEMSVIPEFTLEKQKEIVKDIPKPTHYDRYVAMDIGGSDLTGLLFGYYDFANDKVVIEDEIVMDFQIPGNNIEVLTKQILEKETELYKNHISGEIKKAHLRVSDINIIVLNEICKYSNNVITFMPIVRESKDIGVNAIRTMLLGNKLIISPKCSNLIRHLTNVRWYSANNKTKFSRSPDNGHYDLVDALIYMIRNISYSKNPYPPGYQYNQRDLFINNPYNYNASNKESSSIDFLKKIYKIK